MTLSNDLDRAVAIAVETGAVLLGYFSSCHLGTREKGVGDVVTEADLSSERLVVERLRASFPDDGVIGEEGSRERGRSGRRWYVDPLDGTLNFSREVPLWCVSLALFEDGRPILGVVHDPMRKETFRALRGMGAWKGESRLQTSHTREIDSAFVHLTVDFHEDSRMLGLEDLTALAPAVLRTRNTGSVALALAYIACGRFDALLHRFANTWDYGAGVLLVEEAGGSVTNFEGGPYTESTSALVAAANDGLRGDLLRLVETAGNTRQR